MPQYKQPQKVKTPSFYTCPVETGGTKSAGVTNDERAKLGRNMSRVKNQGGKVAK